MLRLALLALVLLATLAGIVYLFRASVRTWAGDHFQWYRRMRGGRWAQWNGFWEQPVAGDQLMFRRGYLGHDIVEGEAVYEYKTFIGWDDKYITAREDYTAESSASGNIVTSLVLAFAAAVLLAHPVPASADWIAHQGADSVLLTGAPCTNEAVLQYIAPTVRDRFHAASAEIGGKKFEACWSRLAIFAHMVYADGDEGLVPAADLQPLRPT